MRQQPSKEQRRICLASGRLLRAVDGDGGGADVGNSGVGEDGLSSSVTWPCVCSPRQPRRRAEVSAKIRNGKTIEV